MLLENCGDYYLLNFVEQKIETEYQKMELEDQC